MILAISCSSPVVSVAFLSEEGDVLFSSQRSAPMAASGACVGLIEQGLAQIRVSLHDVDLFVADLGPGSFIGTRVGVTLAKTFAFANGKLAAGVPSFDLISAAEPVAVPSRKGEYFIRTVGKEPLRMPSADLPTGVKGYGADFADPTYPNAANVASLIKELKPAAAESLMPEYLIEPSISTPKKAFLVRDEEQGTRSPG